MRAIHTPLHECGTHACMCMHTHTHTHTHTHHAKDPEEVGHEMNDVMHSPRGMQKVQ